MKYLSLIGVLLMLVSCKTNQIPLDTETDIAVMPCGDIIDIHDIQKEFNKLKSKQDLGYAYTYSMVFSKLDSISEQNIRIKTEALTDKIVQQSLPDIKMINDSSKKKEDYNYMMKKFTNIFHHINNDSHLDTKALDELTSESDANKQLILEVRYYMYKNRSTTINVYIIDRQAQDILYYNRINYKCDLRDEASYTKALTYILDKLKQGSV